MATPTAAFLFLGFISSAFQYPNGIHHLRSRRSGAQRSRGTSHPDIAAFACERSLDAPNGLRVVCAMGSQLDFKLIPRLSSLRRSAAVASRRASDCLLGHGWKVAFKVSRALLLILAASLIPGGAAEWFRESGQSNGLWSAWVEKRMVGSPLARALRYEQKLYRQRTGLEEPKLLMVLTSTGSIQYWLGPNGILAAAPNKLYLPDKEEAIELDPPKPRGGTNSSLPHSPIVLSFNRCWYSGEALLYESKLYGGADYILGFFLLSPDPQKISPGRIALEVNNNFHCSDCAWAAQVYGDRILFVGTHLFWQNYGWDNSVYPNQVNDLWRAQRLRVFDLENERLMSGNQIPAELLQRNREALKRVFGTNIISLLGK